VRQGWQKLSAKPGNGLERLKLAEVRREGGESAALDIVNIKSSEYRN